ncbi:unnamed protein product [Allacma fusca]|uniref:Uncharacterized protein n=1 Tax=Allacma fusca TaxID=39272 RepID=A0A8J2MCS6_9HEXA|nr:unnamed protein product [Allacma fusca]
MMGPLKAKAKCTLNHISVLETSLEPRITTHNNKRFCPVACNFNSIVHCTTPLQLGPVPFVRSTAVQLLQCCKGPGILTEKCNFGKIIKKVRSV